MNEDQKAGLPEGSAEEKIAAAMEKASWLRGTIQSEGIDTLQRARFVGANNLEDIEWLLLDALKILGARARLAVLTMGALAEEFSEVSKFIEDGDGYWKPCSGCHESEDGHPVGKYPYSKIFRCDVGAGCHFCGGLGVTWDLLPTEAEIEAMNHELNDPPRAPTERGAEGPEECEFCGHEGDPCGNDIGQYSCTRIGRHPGPCVACGSDHDITGVASKCLHCGGLISDHVGGKTDCMGYPAPEKKA